MGNPNPSPATRFQPGNRANPGGRPKGQTIGVLLRKIWDQRADTDLDGHKIPADSPLTRGQLIAERIARQAEAGDKDFVKIFLDRAFGVVKPPDDAIDGDVRSVLANMALERVIADQARRAAEQVTDE